MKKRSIAKVLILSFITLGIYRLVWIAKTTGELKRKGHEIYSFWLYFAVYAAVFVSLAAFIFTGVKAESDVRDEYCGNLTSYQCENSIYVRDRSPTGAEIASIGAFYFSIFFLLPLTGLWYWKYSKAVEAETKEKMSFAVAMIILIAVPDGFDVMLIQDSYNKLEVPKEGSKK